MTCSLAILVAHTNIRWPVNSRITATDATPKHGGTVCARVSQRLADSLWMASEMKGAPTLLRRDILELPATDIDPAIVSVFECAPWRVTRSEAFSESQHVNLQELGEISRELRESCNRSVLPCRMVNGTDSSVAMGALAKGRSPSLLINGLLREQSAYALFCGRQLSNVKVPTKSNPADDPSRNVPLRLPEHNSPAWLTELLIAEKTKLSWQESIPPALRAFLEEFSGSGGLSRSMRKQGVPCARPREAFPSRGCSGCSTRYVSINDLNDDDTCLYLEEEILNGIYCYIHFGIPCKHWGI